MCSTFHFWCLHILIHHAAKIINHSLNRVDDFSVTDMQMYIFSRPSWLGPSWTCHNPREIKTQWLDSLLNQRVKPTKHTEKYWEWVEISATLCPMLDMWHRAKTAMTIMMMYMDCLHLIYQRVMGSLQFDFLSCQCNSNTIQSNFQEHIFSTSATNSYYLNDWIQSQMSDQYKLI